MSNRRAFTLIELLAVVAIIAGFVDGHVSFIAFHAIGSGLSAGANPPAGYDYKWGD